LGASGDRPQEQFDRSHAKQIEDAFQLRLARFESAVDATAVPSRTSSLWERGGMVAKGWRQSNRCCSLAMGGDASTNEAGKMTIESAAGGGPDLSKTKLARSIRRTKHVLRNEAK
jgi:hypothetical protein